MWRLAMARWSKSFLSKATILCAILASGLVAVSAETETMVEPAQAIVRSTGISWEPMIAYESAVLTVSGPEGYFERQEFAAGDSLRLAIIDKGGGENMADGQYTWELRFTPALAPDIKKALWAARENNDLISITRLRKEGRLPNRPMVASGHFRVEGGVIMIQDAVENQIDFEKRSSGSDPGRVRPESGADADGFATKQLITGDLSVHNSLCVGFDCATSESYGFDTIRLKENSLRIHFDDTSASPFPLNDWRIVVNDSTSGGASYFALQDSTAGRDIFKVEAGAPSNSLYVESDGDVGINTSNPVVEVHVVDGDTPTLRLEQDGSSGFTPQTWDVAGNETNFFIRDVTNGSNLPFRIRPGADSNSLYIDEDNDVGVGTSSPSAALHLRRTNGTAKILVEEASGTEAVRTLFDLQNNGVGYIRLTDTSADGSGWTFQAEGPSFRFNKAGTGGAEIIVRGRNDAGGQATLTVDGSVSADNVVFTSSRFAKTELSAVDSVGVLEKVLALPISEWAFRDENNGRRHIGPMAEEFAETFSLGGGEKNISLIDASGVTFAAIQGLNAKVEATEDVLRRQNEVLERENATLSTRLAEVERQNAELAERLAELEKLLRSDGK
jgi:hypothetical protein